MHRRKAIKKDKKLLTPITLLLVQAYDFLLKDDNKDLSKPYDAICLLLTQPELRKHGFKTQEGNMKPSKYFKGWSIPDFNRAWVLANNSFESKRQTRLVINRRNAPDKKISIPLVLKEGDRIRLEMFKFLGDVRTKLDIDVSLIRDLDIPVPVA